VLNNKIITRYLYCLLLMRCYQYFYIKLWHNPFYHFHTFTTIIFITKSVWKKKYTYSRLRHNMHLPPASVCLVVANNFEKLFNDPQQQCACASIIMILWCIVLSAHLCCSSPSRLIMTSKNYMTVAAPPPSVACRTDVNLFPVPHIQSSGEKKVSVNDCGERRYITGRYFIFFFTFRARLKSLSRLFIILRTGTLCRHIISFPRRMIKYNMINSSRVRSIRYLGGGDGTWRFIAQ